MAYNLIPSLSPAIQNLTNLLFLRTDFSVSKNINAPVNSYELSLKDRCIDVILRKRLPEVTLPQDLQGTLQEVKRICWGCHGSFSGKTGITRLTPVEMAGKKLDNVWVSYCSEICRARIFSKLSVDFWEGIRGLAS